MKASSTAIEQRRSRLEKSLQWRDVAQSEGYERKDGWAGYTAAWAGGRGRVVVGGRGKDGGLLRVYELDAKGTQLRLPLRHEVDTQAAVRSLVCTPDLGHLIAADSHGALTVWELDRLHAHASAPTLRISAHTGAIMAQAIAGNPPDYGNVELVTVGADRAVRLWDLRVPHAAVAQMTGVATSEDPWSVAFGGCLRSSQAESERYLAVGYETGRVCGWDVRKPEAPLFSSKGSGAVSALSMGRPCQKADRLFLGTADGLVELGPWPWAQKNRRSAKIHDSTVWALTAIPHHEDLCVTAGGDGRVCVVYAPDGEELIPLEVAWQSQNVPKEPRMAVSAHPTYPGLLCSVGLRGSVHVAFLDGVSQLD